MNNPSHQVTQSSSPSLGVVFNSMSHTANRVANKCDVAYPAFAEEPISLAVVENTKEPVSLAEALKILDAANDEHEQNAAALLAELNVLMAESNAVVTECNLTEMPL